MALHPLMLSRIQWAWVISWHILLPALTVGLIATPANGNERATPVDCATAGAAMIPCRVGAEV